MTIPEFSPDLVAPGAGIPQIKEGPLYFHRYRNAVRSRVCITETNRL
jgi:hypothetical protein